MHGDAHFLCWRSTAVFGSKHFSSEDFLRTTFLLIGHTRYRFIDCTDLSRRMLPDKCSSPDTRAVSPGAIITLLASKRRYNVRIVYFVTKYLVFCLSHHGYISNTKLSESRIDSSYGRTSGQRLP
ncbi:hypothetical protein EVAR_20450_1 [Eumeta japonica]|uniref:Uncharacterized protein n=1 Tax=Eumeta variegata TaxID=151549 RepID=A0A4C1TYC2_EUMVA|nr:hypothetical protein EVAR_20450_1 [Eumeta japonica]